MSRNLVLSAIFSIVAVVGFLAGKQIGETPRIFDLNRPILHDGTTTELQHWLEGGGSANTLVDGKPLLMRIIDQTKAGSTSHVLVLLNMGADPNVGFDGRTPLDIAIEKRNYLNVVFLVEFGAKLSEIDRVITLLRENKDDDLALRIADYLEFRNQNPISRPLNRWDFMKDIP